MEKRWKRYLELNLGGDNTEKIELGRRVGESGGKVREMEMAVAANVL